MWPVTSCKHVAEIQQNMLESSLNILGDKLFSLVSDGPGKDDLRAKYDAFVLRATRGEADEEQIEYVAASILNASNSEEEISPEMAEQIVQGTDPEFEPMSSVRSNKSIPEANPMDGVQQMSIGEGLMKLLAFNDDLKKSQAGDVNTEKKKRFVHYKFDGDIIVNMDKEVKKFLSEAEHEDLMLSFQEIERIHKITWSDELEKELRESQRQLKEEMMKLQEELREVGKVPHMSFVTKFALLDSGFISPMVPPDFDLEAIMLEVQEQLKEAGVDWEN